MSDLPDVIYVAYDGGEKDFPIWTDDLSNWLPVGDPPVPYVPKSDLDTLIQHIKNNTVCVNADCDDGEVWHYDIINYVPHTWYEPCPLCQSPDIKRLME